jgi:hypothetical protein
MIRLLQPPPEKCARCLGCPRLLPYGQGREENLGDFQRAGGGAALWTDLSAGSQVR